MKRTGIIAVGLLLTASSVTAHHSFAAEYDSAQPVTVSGTVVKIDWTNPHIHFYVDVKNDAGGLTQWKFEGYPPNMLVRQGWKKDETLKPGDMITVSGWHSRLEMNGAASRLVTFADGRKMQSGPPAGTGGQ